MDTLRVAAVQNSAGGDIEANLVRLRELLSDIGGVDLVTVPEVFALRGSAQDYRAVAGPLDGPIVGRLASVALDKGTWVLAGSVIEKDGEHLYNTSVLLDRGGRIAASYRKIHLFEAHLDDGTLIREADAYGPGQMPVAAEVEGWRAGFSICYDLRFPELFRHYAREQADLLLAPSNFTQRTGRDHWEVLVRARAIENQCFVVAPNQCGTNPVTGVVSHGHSMIVGPWGEVLAEAGEQETVLLAELDRAQLGSTRQRIPALNHRVL